MPAMGRAASIVAESADGTLQKLRAGRTGSGRAWTVSPPHPPATSRERMAIVLVGPLLGPETATLPCKVGRAGRAVTGAALDCSLLGEAVPAKFVSAV
jgi:hypothetical protein